MENYRNNSFLNGTVEYSDERNELLESEVDLRRQVEEAAAQEPILPDGASLKEDYIFEENDKSGNKRFVKLSDLFGPGKNSLMVYSFMFSDKNQTPCPSCNSIADAINRMVFYDDQRVNIVIVAKTSIDNFSEWANSHGWNNLHLLSSANNTYISDYSGENEKVNDWPVLNVFRKTDEGIFHSYATELLFAPHEKVMDSTPEDLIRPLWSLSDFMPEARGTNLNARLAY